MCIQSVQSVGVNIFVFEAGLKRSLNHSERCERDTSSRGGKTKTAKKYGKKGHLHSNTEYSAVKYAEKPKKKNLQKGRSREGRAREGNP